MTETPQEASSGQAPDTPLDDVMIAMDVVDTLRHDKRIVERELNNDERRKKLIEELREIYRGQGIEVTDEMLEAGVKALEEERFVYKPPPAGITTSLAKLYATRNQWGAYVIAALAALFVIAVGNYVFIERPRQIAIEQQRIDLTERLPQRLRKLNSDIASETANDEIAKSAEQLQVLGLNAASSGDIETARSATAKLESMLATLREAYTVQIVNRKGELSGLWRVPKANPDTYNYYLVVEAVDEDGNRVPQTILNEETGKRDRVTTWAIRVPKSVLESVRADKNDDGILQNAIAGVKSAGTLEPVWKIPTLSGAITKW